MRYMQGSIISDHQTWASRASGGKTDSSGFALKARVRRVREKMAACARQRRMSQSKWAGLPDSVPLAGGGENRLEGGGLLEDLCKSQGGVWTRLWSSPALKQMQVPPAASGGVDER